MPEVAEVACVTSEIEPYLVGAKLVAARWTEDSKQKGLDTLEFGSTVSTVFSYGKKIVLIVGSQMLVVSLGMNGTLLWGRSAHIKCEFDFMHGDVAFTLYYNRIRPIGNVECWRITSVPDTLLQLRKTYKLGLDVLREPPSAVEWQELLQGKYIRCAGLGPKVRNWTVAKLLPEQGLISGVGNYLRSEILYAARISPKRTVKSLSSNEVETLRCSIIRVAHLTYVAGGFTIENYISPSGKPGGYVSMVYGRNVDPFGHTVMYYSTGGRGIYWVPEMQV